jgi:hypothetical protein
MLGFIYGYVYLHYYNGDDTWKLFHRSLQETDLLLHDPLAFFKNEYTPIHSLAITQSWKEALALYINDLQYALFVKTIAFINIITLGNYYLDSALFNMVVFFGHFWLFRMLTTWFQGNRKLIYYAVFLFLPVVFWISGLRIDGLLFFFLCLFLCQLTIGKKFRLLYLLLSFAGVFICRPEFAIFVLLSAVAYLMAERNQKNASAVFALVYGISIVLFFVNEWIFNEHGIPNIIASIQHKFIALKGTAFHLTTLEAGWFSYMRVLPEAILNTFFRPFIWEAKGALQLMAAFEVILFWCIVIVTFLNRRADWKVRLQHPVILLLLTIAISIYLSVGYIVPFPGAIIRYKAIAELLFICVFASFNKLPTIRIKILNI